MKVEEIFLYFYLIDSFTISGLDSKEVCETFNSGFAGLFTGQEPLKVIALKDKKKWKYKCFPVKFETSKICF